MSVQPVQIIQQIITLEKKKITKHYGIDFSKSDLGQTCLFSGRDIFKNSKTNNCKMLFYRIIYSSKKGD